ncbi:hypothetical protein [Methylobacterium oxalidis]|uniref:hypothetical protein n=1 Tax=Methylobacterium oxalidis TaxID=944322 RepID=UPI0033154F6F
MADLQQEREQLALTERHIAEGEARVAAQKLLVARVSALGQRTAAATDMLRSLEDDLQRMRGHRQAVLEAIDRLTAPAASRRP